jgi:hypothetical protein
LLSLLFDPENGSTTFLLNVSNLLFRLHGVISYKAVPFVVAAARTTSVTKIYKLWKPSDYSFDAERASSGNYSEPTCLENGNAR